MMIKMIFDIPVIINDYIPTGINPKFPEILILIPIGVIILILWIIINKIDKKGKKND